MAECRLMSSKWIGSQSFIIAIMHGIGILLPTETWKYQPREGCIESFWIHNRRLYYELLDNSQVKFSYKHSVLWVVLQTFVLALIFIKDHSHKYMDWNQMSLMMKYNFGNENIEKILKWMSHLSTRIVRLLFWIKTGSIHTVMFST